MDNSVKEITVEEAAKIFSRSQKQIRRIIDLSVGGKLAADGTYEVRPDPLFARRVPQTKGYGFFWLINEERMRKHFEEKLERQMQRIDQARQSALGNDAGSRVESTVKTNSTEKAAESVSHEVESKDAKDILSVYVGLVDTYKKQLEVKDSQLAARDNQISSLIEEVAASKKRSDTLQGALIAIAQGKQLDVQRIQEGEIAIVDAEKPKEPSKKKRRFFGLFGGRD